MIKKNNLQILFLGLKHYLIRQHQKIVECILIMKQMASKDSSRLATYIWMHIKWCLWMVGIVFLSDDPEFIIICYCFFVSVVHWCYIFWRYVCFGICRIYIFQTLINRLRCKQSNIDLILFVFLLCINDFAFCVLWCLATRK